MKKICLFSRKHDDYEFIKVSNHFNDLEIKYVLFPTDDIKDKSTIFNYEIASYNDFGKILQPCIRLYISIYLYFSLVFFVFLLFFYYFLFLYKNYILSFHFVQNRVY